MLKAIKNIQAYTLNREIKMPTNEQMAEFEFTPCGSHDMLKMGWVPAIDGGELVAEHNGTVTLKFRTQEKQLPSAKVNKEVSARVSKHEKLTGMKTKKKEKDQIKDDVINELLPRAFEKDTDTLMMINQEMGLIYVNSSSANRAEDALALLRKTIGSLPVVPVMFTTLTDRAMTKWVEDDELPERFVCGSEAKMESLAKGQGVAKIKNLNMDSVHVADLICDNFIITELELEYDGAVSFVLNEFNALKKIKWDDSLIDQNSDIDPEEKHSRFFADLVIAVGTFNRLFGELYDSLGKPE